MKKVLIGAGIGVAALVLIAVVAGGLWAKSKVTGFVENAQEIGDKAAEAQDRIEALDKKFAFQAPPKGVPVAIQESRLQDYLAVRSALRPIYETYAKKAEELKERSGDKPGVGAAVEAMGQLATFLGSVQSTWLDQLEAKKMAPREFHAITAALYTSNWGVAKAEMQKQQRPALEEMKKALEQQIAQAPSDDVRQMLKAQLEGIDEQLAALPPADAEPSQADKVHQANHVLYAKYQQQIEQAAEHGLDMLLMGSGAGDALGDAMEDLAQDDAAE